MSRAKDAAKFEPCGTSLSNSTNVYTYWSAALVIQCDMLVAAGVTTKDICYSELSTSYKRADNIAERLYCKI